MFKEDINNIERVRLSLFDLKPKTVLNDIYNMYNEYLSQFFEDGEPIPEYFNKVNCPICGDKKTKQILVLDNIRYHECDTCHSVYTPDMLKDEILMDMYSSGAYQEYFKKLVLQGQDLRKNTLELRKVRQLSSFFSKPGKILDVGCGSGSFLKVCQEHGWDVYGIDPSDAAVKTAKEKYDLDITKGFFEDYKSDEKFNCIVILGIEHLQDPYGSLKKAHELLEDGGVVFFEVPSADCYLLNYIKKYPFDVTRYIESGRHYLFFSQQTINYICRSLGYELLHIDSNGLDVDTIIFDDVGSELKEKLLNMQEIINSMLLGDHYRVFMRKVS